MGTDKNGWVKLHRKILDNPVCSKKPTYFAIWVFLILNATHEEYETVFAGKKRVLKPGELITSRKTISAQFGIPESTVYKVIKKFEMEHQIEQQTSKQNTLISLVNWERYQEKGTTNGTKKEQQRNTNKKKEIYSANLQNSLNQIFENVMVNFPKDKQTKKNFDLFMGLVKDAGEENDIENKARNIQSYLDRLPEQQITFKEFTEQWQRISKKD